MFSNLTYTFFKLLSTGFDVFALSSLNFYSSCDHFLCYFFSLFLWKTRIPNDSTPFEAILNRQCSTFAYSSPRLRTLLRSPRLPFLNPMNPDEPLHNNIISLPPSSARPHIRRRIRMHHTESVTIGLTPLWRYKPWTCGACLTGQDGFVQVGRGSSWPAENPLGNASLCFPLRLLTER